MRFKLVRAQPETLHRISVGFFCAAAFIFQLKHAMLPDLDYGWVALALLGAFLFKYEAHEQ